MIKRNTLVSFNLLVVFFLPLFLFVPSLIINGSISGVSKIGLVIYAVMLVVSIFEIWFVSVSILELHLKAQDKKIGWYISLMPFYFSFKYNWKMLKNPGLLGIRVSTLSLTMIGYWIAAAFMWNQHQSLILPISMFAYAGVITVLVIFEWSKLCIDFL